MLDISQQPLLGLLLLMCRMAPFIVKENEAASAAYFLEEDGCYCQRKRLNDGLLMTA
jgi:hypothetical protein